MESNSSSGLEDNDTIIRQDSNTEASNHSLNVVNNISIASSMCFNLEYIEEKLNSILNVAEVENTIFDAIREDHAEVVNINKFWECLRNVGIQKDDPRLVSTREKFKQHTEDFKVKEDRFYVSRESFRKSIQQNIILIVRAFKKHLIIPEFENFKDELVEIFEICKTNLNGKVADYIPQLSRMDPKLWGVSVCTIDGQTLNIGDVNVPFCIQSCCKTLNYAIAVTEHDEKFVHGFVGREPSGKGFNELTLDQNKKPHNPMINAGAIIISSLIKNTMCFSDRFDYIFNQYKRIAGQCYVGFSNSIYLSERDTADRNFALGYFMRQNNCFPANTNLVKTLELYFQLCSVEITAKSGGIIAGTLANGGERVMDHNAVRNTLSLMHSCGMYDYSGHFAFKVGLPAKSGVSGCILMVVPNVMGICTWSPCLDTCGNSVRGVEFCERLTSRFIFHKYDNANHSTEKLDPIITTKREFAQDVVNMINKASIGDATSLLRYRLMGKDLSSFDYDGRTCLHVAASEGKLYIVQLLVEKCNVPLDHKDRWGNTPIDDAILFKHEKVVNYLNGKMAQNNVENEQI